MEQLRRLADQDPNQSVDISPYINQLSVDQLEQLRNSKMNLIWNDVNHYITKNVIIKYRSYYEFFVYKDGASVELILEAIEWLNCDLPEFDYLPDDRIIEKLLQYQIPISFEIRHYDDDLKYVIEYVDKHRLAGIPVAIDLRDDNILHSFCELINYPIKIVGIIPNNMKAQAFHSDDKAAINQIDKVEHQDLAYYIYEWSAKAIYNLSQYPNLTTEIEFSYLFFNLVNTDYHLEYCTLPQFDECWKLISVRSLTNRNAINHAAGMGIKMIDINDTFSLNKQYENNLLWEYKAIDVIERFDYPDQLIKLLESDVENIVKGTIIGIIIRLLKRRLINLNPYKGRHPNIDLLIPYQYVPMVKNANSKK